MTVPKTGFNPISFRKSVVELLESSESEAADFDRLLKLVEAASQRFASSSRLKCLLGDILALQSCRVANTSAVREEAEAAYTDASKFDPFDPEPHRSLAGLSGMRGQVLEAEEHLERALACEESFAVYMALLNLFVDHEMWDKASLALEDAAHYLKVQEAKLIAAKAEFPKA